MLNRLGNDEISRALDELITCLGIKEEMACDDLVVFLRKKDAEGCVKEIATRVGLPIRVNLTYVPKDFRPGNTNRFHSSALAETDWSGGGTGGITAQVSIPQHLPMFGTPGLQGYPIQVRVSEDCHAHPDAFVAIMTHELSHVLLASLWSTHRDSELHADLVPIILGFRDVVQRGRKTIECTTSGNITTTRTTTYGYLTDAQFEFACNCVTELLHRHSQDRKRLLELVEQGKGKLAKAVRSLASFRDYFRYLDIHPAERMRKGDAERVVQLHGHDCSGEWESRITAVRRSVEIAETFARPLHHYQPRTIEYLKTHIRALEVASEELDRVTEAIAKDERMLRKYVGFIWKLQRTLRHDS